MVLYVPSGVLFLTTIWGEPCGLRGLGATKEDHGRQTTDDRRWTTDDGRP